MKFPLPFILLSALLFSSCKKDPISPSSGDYIVFGHFYGECAGGEQCVEIFKLEGNQLLEDTKDHYPKASEFYEGNYVPLSQQQFLEAKDLLNYFPRALWEEDNNIIGQPDATDGGGLYIEFQHKGKRKVWLLDKMKSKVPAQYHAFMDRVNETIQRIQ